MKIILFSLCFLIASFNGFCQQKGAQINIIQFLRANGRYIVQCEVNYYNRNTDPRSGNYLMFFIKEYNNPIKLIEVESNSKSDYEGLNYYKLNPYENEYRIVLIPKSFNETRFTLYPVLVSGNISNFEKVSTYLDNEFYKINDILNVLYKSELTPLTYSEKIE
jgi:hypothetical protein